MVRLSKDTRRHSCSGGAAGVDGQTSWPLEHCVCMGGFTGHNLQDVPVLDDLATFIEAEDVNARPILVCVCGPLLVAMQDNKVSFSDGSLEVHALSWVLQRHAFEVLDEGLLSVGNVWVVLGVRITCVALNCFGRVALVEHEFVERHRIPLVAVEVLAHLQSSRLTLCLR